MGWLSVLLGVVWWVAAVLFWRVWRVGFGVALDGLGGGGRCALSSVFSVSLMFCEIVVTQGDL